MDETQQQPSSRMTLNTNTGVSIGIIVLMFAGFWGVMAGINSMKRDIDITQSQIGAARTEVSGQVAALRMELNGRIDKVEARAITLEAKSNSWNSTAMFKWAVHLQQANPQIKVPEPEVDTSR